MIKYFKRRRGNTKFENHWISANKPNCVNKPNHTETRWQKARVFKRKQRQKRTYVLYVTADSNHCFDVLGLISAVGFFTCKRVWKRGFLQVLGTGMVTNHKQKNFSQRYAALSNCRSRQLH